MWRIVRSLISFPTVVYALDFKFKKNSLLIDYLRRIRFSRVEISTAGMGEES